MAEGIVTYGDRAPVDPALAAKQHAGYVAAVADVGWEIREVPHADDMPDSAFVEDTVVVCGELAVLDATRGGGAARRGGGHRGGGSGAWTRHRADRGARHAGRRGRAEDRHDAVRRPWRAHERRGHSPAAGAGGPRGFTVVPVPLQRVLHLKSAVTALPDGTVIAADPSLLDTSPFPTLRIVPEEAGSHVILLGDGAVLMAASAPQSAELFDDWGFDVSPSTSASSRRWRAA